MMRRLEMQLLLLVDKGTLFLVPEPHYDHGFQLIGIELADVDRLSKLPRHHRDPFDRMLVAQALRSDCALVTKDQVVSEYRVQTLW